MCTYNGERFLQEQLESFVEQSHKNWSLWVSDDGSSDQTLKILEGFKVKNPDHEITVLQGPQNGFCANFLSLMCREEIQTDYYALSDQDDIWLPEKLERSILKMQETGAAFYGGRTISIDEKGEKVGISPLFKKPPSFRNALVQSIMGGNTMVFDQEGIDLIRRAGIVDVQSHDWWAYILVMGAGRAVYYDTEAFLLYRQHGANLIGSNSGFLAQLNRIGKLFRSEFKEWNGRHVRAIKNILPALTPKHQQMYQDFAELRQVKGFGAIFRLRKLQLVRQTSSGTLALILAAIMGKL